MKGSVNIGGVKDISESPLRVLSGPPQCPRIGETEIVYDFNLRYDNNSGGKNLSINPPFGTGFPNPPFGLPFGKWILLITVTVNSPIGMSFGIGMGQNCGTQFNTEVGAGRFLINNAWGGVILGKLHGQPSDARTTNSWADDSHSVSDSGNVFSASGPDLFNLATIDLSVTGQRIIQAILPEQSEFCTYGFVPYIFTDRAIGLFGFLGWKTSMNGFAQIQGWQLVLPENLVGLYPDQTIIGNLQFKFLRSPKTPLFTYSLSPPSTVAFSNKTFFNPGLGPTWDWDFGDGTAPSTQQNPSHAYPSTGTYHVTLRATDPVDTKSFDQIVVLPLKADFTYVFFIGTFNANLSVTDRSIGATTWDWDFGDGSPHQHTQNVANYHYPKGQTFIVTLTIGDGSGKTALISKVIAT